jgi:O-antigen ligase
MSATVVKSIQLARWQQFLTGSVVLLLFGLSLWIGNPLIPVGIVAAVLLLWLIVRTPFNSLLTLIAANVLLSLKPRPAANADGAPSLLDVVFGIILIGVSVYWVVRLKILERKPLGVHRAQLYISLFIAWSIAMTLIGIAVFDDRPAAGIREILNLLPLLIIPMLYCESVVGRRDRERTLFLICIAAAIVIVIANIIAFRSNVVNAVYAYEMGRSALDLAATTMLTIMMASFLMSDLRKRSIILASIALILSFAGVVVSFTRTFYALVPAAIILLFFLGTKIERRRGIKRLFLISGLSALIGIALFVSHRLVRLLVLTFTARLLTTHKVTTDLSLLNRYAEWHGILHSIAYSPIVGYGFGGVFRYFQIVQHFHVWSAFSHNSYLYLWYKSGIVGLMLFMLANMEVLITGWRTMKSSRLSKRELGAVRGAFVFIILTLIAAYRSDVRFEDRTHMGRTGLGLSD